eukprot:SAG11_NODE_135_length_15131_cov_9.906599_7_plen_63_part_00
MHVPFEAFATLVSALVQFSNGAYVGDVISANEKTFTVHFACDNTTCASSPPNYHVHFLMHSC